MFGTCAVVPVVGSNKYCWPAELKSPWNVNTLPVDVNAACIATSG